MQNALDTFRAQREAVDRVHARLTEVAQLLERLTRQVDAVAGNTDLRSVLRDERDWLRQAQALVADVRHFREQERLRFWPGVWRRWAVAVLFALASAAAAGAGYALVADERFVGGDAPRVLEPNSLPSTQGPNPSRRFNPFHRPLGLAEKDVRSG